MTPLDDTDATIRCRLSDGFAAAEEFSAHDGRSLAAESGRAFARYVSARGERPLAIQVRPVGSAGDGWFTPVRNRAPVRVIVSAATLGQRPPDDWTEIWGWIVASRAGDRQLSGFLTDARAFGLLDSTRGDEDADG